MRPLRRRRPAPPARRVRGPARPRRSRATSRPSSWAPATSRCSPCAPSPARGCRPSPGAPPSAFEVAVPPLNGAFVVGVQVDDEVDVRPAGDGPPLRRGLLGRSRRTAAGAAARAGRASRVTVRAGAPVVSRARERLLRLHGLRPGAHAGRGCATTCRGSPTGRCSSWPAGAASSSACCARRGSRPSGVDLDEGMVATARAAGHDVRARRRAARACAPAPTAACAASSRAHFVEHLGPTALQAVVAESARVLAPGGHFVAATPERRVPVGARPRLLGRPDARAAVRPPPARLLLRAAGLEVVETGANPRNHGGPPPAVLPPEVHVDPDLRPQVVAALQGPDAPTGTRSATCVGVLEERLRGDPGRARGAAAVVRPAARPALPAQRGLRGRPCR